jgi:penicillin-binding protein 2
MFRFFSRGRFSGREIEPDEILLDARNLPSLNTHQFEGRFERPIGRHPFVIFGLICSTVGCIFAVRAWNLMVRDGEGYARQSENNRLREIVMFAPRGVIYDRNGLELAWNEYNEREAFAERRYRDAAGLSHVVGYVSYPSRDAQGFFYREDFLGRAGAEELFDPKLAGKNGFALVETTALGEVLSKSSIRVPEAGQNMTLSVDARVTEQLAKEIERLASKVGFTGGAGVILDVKSGEILALTSVPDYRSEVLTNENHEAAIAAIRDNPSLPFLNRAVSGLYAPGSIVKPFMALAGLAEGVITPGKEIISTGALVVPNPYNPDQPSVFRDWKAHGSVDMVRALAVSSDEYFYRLGGGYGGDVGLGIERIERYMRAFGFGASTGLLLSPEPAGVIPSPAWKRREFGEDESWLLGNTYHTAIGQYGFQVTPLQSVRAIAAIATNGILPTPTLVANASTSPAHITEEVRASDFVIVRKGMRAAVTDGTARGLSMYDVEIAAKTGTAELGDRRHVNSWVVGFFPYEKPRYAFVVVMEKGPVENLTGATFVMRQVLDWMATTTPEYLR